MAKKKERAFFTCPAWNELSDTTTTLPRIHDKHLATLKAGQPMVKSTLRKALLAVQKASGTRFDVEAYIVDQRSVPPR